jgi:hypothetical protein
VSGHTDEEKRRIEQDLPPGLRGRGAGYRRMLEDISLRVAVDGIRGKSSLTKAVDDELRRRGLTTYAKETGTDPISYDDGTPHPIDRRGEDVTLDETVWEMKSYFPYQAAVVENQAIGGYTMRFFNRRILDPHYLLVTNVRRDHQGDIHRDLEGIARAFGRAANPGSTLICGERRPELRGIVREEATDRGARFVAADVPEDDYVPGLETLAILDALLDDAFDDGLSADRRQRERYHLEQRFSWRDASRPGLRWFPAAEVNDVDSTQAILDHLLDQRDVPVTFVAYFRPDRRDRTASFVPFLRRHLEDGTAEGAYLAGAGAEVVQRRLSDLGDRATVVEADPDRAETIVDQIHDSSQAGHVMTVGNAVPPFPRAIQAELSTDEPPEDVTFEPVTFEPVRRRTRSPPRAPKVSP